MNKRYSVFMILTALMAMFNLSCDKEGELFVKPVTKIRPIKINGFVLADTLEQCFDGVKMRDLYGNVSFNGNLAYESDEPILMEFKKKTTGEVVYSSRIEKDGPADQAINFYYDGNKLTESYNAPAGIEGVEQMAFYLDVPAGMAADIVYIDNSDFSIVGYLAKNVQPKTWTEFIQVSPIDQSVSVVFLKAGTREYLIGNNINFSFMSGVQFPANGGYPGGGVQSWYVGWSKQADVGIAYPDEQWEMNWVYKR